MENLIQSLLKNELFNNMKDEEIKKVMGKSKYTINSYKKGNIIFQEDDTCSSIGLVIEGNIIIERIYLNGKGVVLGKFGIGDVFGEALVFSKMSLYPATVSAMSDCKILYIDKNEFAKLLSSETTILENFTMLLSEKIILLNEKIRSISLRNVKSKVAYYIIEEFNRQKNNILKLEYTKEEIASDIGIPRPSLSRELINLKKDKIIDYDRNKITILKMDKLEDILFDS